MKMSAAGPHTKKITNDEGKTIGLAVELANGRWAPFDKEEKTRLVETGISFEKPKDVLNFFKAATAGQKRDMMTHALGGQM